MKITLTTTQRDEILSKLQAIQNEAYQQYIKARDSYNTGLASLKAGEIELSDLLVLTAGLPDAPPTPKPITVTHGGTSTRYTAYSRTGRRENGGLAVHDISVTKEHIGGLNYAYAVQCTCPGFRFNGTCWASTEAREQAKSQTRANGTNNVWKR